MVKAGDVHERHMRRAVEVARRNPDAPFGTVVADRETGEVVVEGLNKAGENPILHGEIDALLRLSAACPGVDPARLVLYTTAEPCPMCSGAILWYGIPRVVYGTSIQTLINLGIPQVDLSAQEVAARSNFSRFEIIGGVLEVECNALFEEMARRMRF